MLDKYKNLATRIATGSVLAFIAIVLSQSSGIWFFLFTSFVALLAGLEWKKITTFKKLRIKLFGFLYILVPMFSLLYMKYFGDILTGDPLLNKSVVYLFLIIWSTDVFAYICGRSIGGKKLAPSVSPGKTWAGAIGGLIGALSIAALLQFLWGYNLNDFNIFTSATLISLASQLGDLFESWIKRQAGVKDSGRLIPGHGGVLDRIDGLLFAAPIYLCYLIIMVSYV